MKGLTAKEEEIMGFFWKKGPLFVKEMLAFYDEPKPHFNTLSTIVRGLEDKGFLAHKIYGNTYQYYATVSAEDFHKGTLKNVIRKYFNNSYLSALSSLVSEEDISLDDLKQALYVKWKMHIIKNRMCHKRKNLWEPFLSTY
ncbi:BlaI/MecI/CopY family transcriptional regulator [Bacteroides salyersiae]|nr:BlaI/MecI/CopY family transcriptional regulator [Bacteroides salyersiae]